ncbi:motile sperm domain containing 2-like protein [Euroglyphus maynei]|uniref:Motile sperm domain containing 2-like protein n=1 Tax=Euroglyphus maynei TaxID=6958 RepID=A0A1Y3B9Z8_EURMA|nr:motile sperm domain containing 2-like protein [Euroglyphus maynei]
MARFIINTLSNYYSGAISYVYIYELPWILNQIWRLVRSWLDEDAKSIVRFVTIENIFEYIEASNLPDYMGGYCRKDYRFVPKGVPSLEEMTINNGGTKKFGIKSDKDLKKLTEHFQKLIKLQ